MSTNERRVVVMFKGDSLAALEKLEKASVSAAALAGLDAVDSTSAIIRACVVDAWVRAMGGGK